MNVPIREAFTASLSSHGTATMESLYETLTTGPLHLGTLIWNPYHGFHHGGPPPMKLLIIGFPTLTLEPSMSLAVPGEIKTESQR